MVIHVVLFHMLGLSVGRGISGCPRDDKGCILQVAKMEAGHAQEES